MLEKIPDTIQSGDLYDLFFACTISIMPSWHPERKKYFCHKHRMITKEKVQKTEQDASKGNEFSGETPRSS